MLPDYLCQEGLADNRLVRVLPGWAPQTKFGTLISAVCTAERMRLQHHQVLLTFLRQQLAAAQRAQPPRRVRPRTPAGEAPHPARRGPPYTASRCHSVARSVALSPRPSSTTAPRSSA